jgi:hypothetical protein
MTLLNTLSLLFVISVGYSLARHLPFPVCVATVKSQPERLGIPDVRMPPLDAVDHLVDRSAAALGAQGGLEAGAIHVVVELEIVSQRPIVFLFGIAQPEPPILPGSVEAFRLRLC